MYDKYIHKYFVCQKFLSDFSEVLLFFYQESIVKGKRKEKLTLFRMFS